MSAHFGHPADIRVLTLGETGVLLDPVEEDEPQTGSLYRVRVSGAESNFAIALSRLGVATTWISRLGADPLGDLIMRTLVAEGVDVRFVNRDETAPTALAFKIRKEGSTRLVYHRRGSAASRLQPDEIPDGAFDGVRVVHLTGITMAIGDGPRESVVAAAERARERGITVTFDLNYRAALWTAREAATSCARILPLADWVLGGEEECRLLFGGSDRASVLAGLAGAGASRVVLRIGAEGALVTVPDGLVHIPACAIPGIVDEIGAGDAFDAGFVYGIVRDLGPEASARMGNLLASRALAGTGDWETLPRLDEIASLLPALR